MSSKYSLCCLKHNARNWHCQLQVSCFSQLVRFMILVLWALTPYHHLGIIMYWRRCSWGLGLIAKWHSWVPKMVTWTGGQRSSLCQCFSRIMSQWLLGTLHDGGRDQLRYLAGKGSGIRTSSDLHSEWAEARYDERMIFRWFLRMLEFRSSHATLPFQLTRPSCSFSCEACAPPYRELVQFQREWLRVSLQYRLRFWGRLIITFWQM